MTDLQPDIVDARERPLTPDDFEAILRFLPGFEQSDVPVNSRG
jgi:hypothetical protein